MLGSLQSLGEECCPPDCWCRRVGGGIAAPGRPRSGTRRSLQQAPTARASRSPASAASRRRSPLRRTSFAYAAVEIRLGDGDGVALVAQLHEFDPAMRIVVVTGFDSFASVIVALRAGAVDYLPKPIQAGEPANALLGRLLPPLRCPTRRSASLVSGGSISSGSSSNATGTRPGRRSSFGCIVGPCSGFWPSMRRASAM